MLKRVLAFGLCLGMGWFTLHVVDNADAQVEGPVANDEERSFGETST